MNQFLIDLLKRLSQQLDGADDVGIAKRLDVPRGTPAQWRTGEKRMEEKTVRLIADILGEDPDNLVLKVARECAPDERTRNAYSRLLDERSPD